MAGGCSVRRSDSRSDFPVLSNEKFSAICHYSCTRPLGASVNEWRIKIGIYLNEK